MSSLLDHLQANLSPYLTFFPIILLCIRLLLRLAIWRFRSNTRSSSLWYDDILAIVSTASYSLSIYISAYHLDHNHPSTTTTDMALEQEKLHLLTLLHILTTSSTLLSALAHLHRILPQTEQTRRTTTFLVTLVLISTTIMIRFAGSTWPGLPSTPHHQHPLTSISTSAMPTTFFDLIVLLSMCGLLCLVGFWRRRWKRAVAVAAAVGDGDGDESKAAMIESKNTTAWLMMAGFLVFAVVWIVLLILEIVIVLAYALPVFYSSSFSPSSSFSSVESNQIVRLEGVERVLIYGLLEQWVGLAGVHGLGVLGAAAVAVAAVRWDSIPFHGVSGHSCGDKEEERSLV